MLTFRSDDPKHQKIGFVSDHCRKIADTFLVVREKNQRTVGWHFHAILICKKEPPKSWYKKGVHIHLKKVGKRDSLVGMVLPQPDLTAQEVAEALHHEPALSGHMEQHMINVCLAKHAKHKSLTDHRERVCNYLFKDVNKDHVQYVDYILRKSGNNESIDLS